MGDIHSEIYRILQENHYTLFVINRSDEGKKWEMDIATIQDMLEVPILGVIPEDDAIKESQRMKNINIEAVKKCKQKR